MMGQMSEDRRERIISRTDEDLKRARARIEETLKQYLPATLQEEEDFEKELTFLDPDTEDLALRAEIAEHEEVLEEKRWEEIIRISERNRARK